MKTVRSLLTLLIPLAFAATLLDAAELVAGPKGGRLFSIPPLRAEFFVTADRKAEVTFYDAALQPVAPGAQRVSVIAEAPAQRLKLDLAKTATGFASTATLPEGEPYRIVLQIRAAPDAQPHNFRLDLNLATCGECQHAEYACTCKGH